MYLWIEPMRPLHATVCLLAASAAVPALAEVVTDSTVGRAAGSTDRTLRWAPISARGRGATCNLFHSSERFSLATGESATFPGPNEVRRMISRVTGGARSEIDGTLRSTIPGADFYFLNPAGVVFGPDARLDLQGSFHVSTADELRFADGTAFSAANSFTIAAPDDTGASDASAGISIDAESVTIGSDSWQLSPPGARVLPVA